MRVSQQGLEFIENEEGYREKMYLDVAGYETIGIGHLLRANELSSGEIDIAGEKVKWANGLTKDQVYDLLRQDLAWAEAAVNSRVTIALTQHEFDSLVSFVFNVGGPAFGRSTLLRKLNNGDKEDVPAQMARWNRSGGKVWRGLTLRRQREGELFRDGRY